MARGFLAYVPSCIFGARAYVIECWVDSASDTGSDDVDFAGGRSWRVTVFVMPWALSSITAFEAISAASASGTRHGARGSSPAP